ncbi:MAG: hypothetical protein ACRD2Z_06920 [Thermoanaerobaculia bacterium]
MRRARFASHVRSLRRSVPVVAMALAVAGQLSVSTTAQEPSEAMRHRPPERVRVILYRDLNLSGVHEGFARDVADLRGSRIGDNQATSVQVARGCRVRLYQHPNYGGRYTEVEGALRDLRGSQVGDDGASSLKVRCFGDGGWDEPSSRSGVTLYRDLGFRGVSETFARDVPDLRASRIGDDEATSARAARGCRARLYQHPDYGGRYTEVDGALPDLRGSAVGDDGASSLRVRCAGEGWGDWPGDGGGGVRRGVTLFRDLEFRGVGETFYGSVADLRGTRVGDDQATSVRVDRGCRARLYQHPNFGGLYTELDGDAPDLRGSRVGDDSVSSLQVLCR